MQFFEDINIEVTVHAIRHPQSKICFGNISLDVWTLAEAHGNRELFGHLYLSTYSKIVYNPKNFNIPVLDLVKEALQEWLILHRIGASRLADEYMQRKWGAFAFTHLLALNSPLDSMQCSSN